MTHFYQKSVLSFITAILLCTATTARASLKLCDSDAECSTLLTGIISVMPFMASHEASQASERNSRDKPQAQKHQGNDAILVPEQDYTVAAVQTTPRGDLRIVLQPTETTAAPITLDAPAYTAKTDLAIWEKKVVTAQTTPYGWRLMGGETRQDIAFVVLSRHGLAQTQSVKIH